MKVVTAEQMRELDRRTISEFGVSGEVLMERAGRAVAETAERLARLSSAPDGPVRLFAGRGNNGGDVFVAAHWLAGWGRDAEVWIAGRADGIRGDARANLERMKQAGVPFRELTDAAEWGRVAGPCPPAGGVLVDGLLGTGSSGPPRDPVAVAVRCLNALGERNRVVAVDVPSGVDADTGTAPGEAVVADVTVTMGLPKRGLAEAASLDFTGSVEVADIGIPAELIAAVRSDTDLIATGDLRPLLGARPRAAHKGVFGRALLIGGAAGYTGAIALAAGAALRSGVGLVTVLTPARMAPIVAGLAPEAMVHAGPETDAGTLAADCLGGRLGSPADFDAVLVGPGMTTHEETRRLVERLLRECRSVLVLDADALNASTGRLDSIRAASCPVILTPHPGEMGRLLGIGAGAVQRDRRAAALRAAKETGAVVLLKGAGTLVAADGRPLSVNRTGNPGMAAGGMGDVLAGLVAGLAATGMTAFDAARCAAYVHGRAGDLGAWRGSQAGLVAGDLIRELPAVFGEISRR